MESQVVYNDGIKYRSETKIVPFGKGTIKLTNLTPILTPKEYAKRHREIETLLYNIFSKYEKPTDSIG